MQIGLVGTVKLNRTIKVTMLQNVNLKKIFSFLTVFITAVILFFSLLRGAEAGKQLAKAEVIGKNARSVAAGLHFFYRDQNRFPSGVEFGQPPVMLNYVNPYPPMEFPSSLCPSTFIYKREALQNFQLNFCLPKAIDGFSAGWNTLSGSPGSGTAGQQ